MKDILQKIVKLISVRFYILAGIVQSDFSLIYD